MKNAYKSLVGKSKGTDYLELCSVWELVLKEDINKYAVKYVDWIRRLKVWCSRGLCRKRNETGYFLTRWSCIIVLPGLFDMELVNNLQNFSNVLLTELFLTTG